ncbi:MAG: GDSL-type esterase/lipase family protein [Candidatus Binatia bacterium]|jgi:lysophospholipase L1-like esterase
MAERGGCTLGTKTAVLIQIGAGAVLTVLLLVVAEIACGFFVGRDDQTENPIIFMNARDHFIAETFKWAESNPLPSVKDLDLLWRNAPSVTKIAPVNPQAYGHNDTWTIRINSEGFRGPEPENKDAPEGVYRIIFVGDSVTFGYGVEEHDSFVGRVVATLRTRYPDRRFDIVNAGVPGWSWVQGLRFLQVRGLSLHPNLVVMAHGVNDQLLPAEITDNELISALEKPAPRLLERVRGILSRTNMYRLAHRLVAARTGQPQVSPNCERQIRSTGACRRVGLDEIEAAVHAARRLTSAAGADLLVLNLDFWETLAARAVRAAVDTDHIPFLDFPKQFDHLREADESRRARDFGLAPMNAVDTNRRQTKGAWQVIFRVLMGNVVGPFSVKAFAFPVATAFQIEAPLYDDGTHGDEIPNDGIASAVVNVPAGVGIVHYLFYADGVPEFRSPPGEIQSDPYREVRRQADVVRLLDVFAQQFLMVEHTHPNADGHRVIAEGVLQAMDSIDSFASFVGPARVVRPDLDAG